MFDYNIFEAFKRPELVTRSVQMLDKAPAMVDFQRRLGDETTLLMAAARWGDTHAAEYLLTRLGADPDLCDVNGLRAVDIAAKFDHDDTVALLRKHASRPAGPAWLDGGADGSGGRAGDDGNGNGGGGGGGGGVWNSGGIVSSEPFFAADAEALAKGGLVSGVEYVWSVNITVTAADVPTPQPAGTCGGRFRTAPSLSVFPGKAKWIGGGGLLTASFTVSSNSTSKPADTADNADTATSINKNAGARATSDGRDSESRSLVSVVAYATGLGACVRACVRACV